MMIHTMICRASVLTLCAAAAIALEPGPLLAAGKSARGPRVTVQLASGRSFTAQVDNRTDDRRLWLRFVRKNAILLRPIAWSSIIIASYEGDLLNHEQLRDALDRQGFINDHRVARRPAPRERIQTREVIPASSASELDESNVAQRRTGNAINNKDEIVNAHSGPADDVTAQPVVPQAKQLQAVHFEPSLANWDADVEDDGLIIHVYPLDGESNVMRIHGTLEVELIAPVRVAYDGVPQGRGRISRRLGRWVEVVRPESIGPHGASFKLPFQALHPEFDIEVGSRALVHLRLTAPGHGVFEYTAGPVRIRQFNPIRDELQRNTGKRFLPVERTGRGKMAAKKVQD